MSTTRSPSLTAGRTLLSLLAVTQSIGPYMADWSPSHVLNPNWPPHARFHNGQTMSLGLCLGLLTGWFAWRPIFVGQSHHTSKSGSEGAGGSGMTEKESITISAVMGTLYWISGLSAILYPGTMWVDPEFGTGAPQVPLFLGLAGVAWAGWGLEMRRLNGLKRKGL